MRDCCCFFRPQSTEKTWELELNLTTIVAAYDQDDNSTGIDT